MKKHNKAVKLISLLGIGLATVTTGIAATISLSSCKKNNEENKPVENHELFEYSDEKQTKITALTEYAKKQTTLVVPKTVKSFDSKVFQNLKTTKIKEIDFSKCTKITTLPAKAFSKSSNIRTLLLPPNLTTISETSISDLVNIERITWPSKISTNDMIKATWNLPIFIPDCNDNVPNQDLQPSIAKSTFNGKSVSPTEKNAKIYLVPNKIAVFKNVYQKFGQNVKNLYFQDKSTLTTISDNFFRDNGEIERIIFPSSLVKITSANFWNMGSLIELNSEDNFKNLEEFGSWNFVNCPKLKYLNFSGNNTIIGAHNTTFSKLESLEYLLLPNSFNTFNPLGSGNNIYFNDKWDSLKYMPMPRQFNFNTVNNQANRCSGKLRFIKPENNKIDYSELYKDEVVTGIWIDGLSTKVNKPDISKIPNLKFISYRDKTEYLK